MKKYNLYISAVLATFLVSCAHELPLTGGEKDTKPPVAEKFEPPNQSIRFTAKKITIEFDEFVKLKEPTKQILISPPGTTFEAVEKGKSIQLTITSTLKENSTYVINFGKAVVDNNEGNILENFIYSFSTGETIDSLSSKFVVIDAFTLKPLADVKVMLYDRDIDSLPLKELPYYAGSTGVEGKISIGYMKPGNFKVFALLEENKNYLYDKPNEGIGFLNLLIPAGDSIPLKIHFFNEEVSNPKILSVKMPIAGMVCFKFNGKVEKEQLRVIGKNNVFDSSRFEFIARPDDPFGQGRKRDTAVYWFKSNGINDSLQWLFSRKGGEKDTIKLYPQKINLFTKKQVTGAQLVKIVTVVPADFDYYKKLALEFSYPLDSIGKDAFILKEEGAKVTYLLTPVDSSKRKYVFQYAFKQSKNYTVYFPRNSLKSIMGTYIDSTVISFKTSNDKMYKTLTMNIKNPEFKGGAILQILDIKDAILEEKKIVWADSNVVLFKNLRQGSYRVRLIYDTNNNGKWDTGKYADKRQPEKVVYFPQSIDIKPAFDYVMEWDIKK